MKGDFSRLTFDEARRFNSVRLQQGRVLNEADWNEDRDIAGHRLDRSLRDVIGDAAGPVDPDSFKVELNGTATAITVSPGRYYVGGRLLENFAPVTLPAQPFLAGGYCVLGTGDSVFGAASLAAGDYAVILDSWVRHVTVLEMPELLEPALGGVTTATRLQSVWQLKLLALPTGTVCGGVQGTPAWAANFGAITAAMEAGTDMPPPAPDNCDLSPSGGYQGLENDLFRVEIHTPGAAGIATYKWSIDNASFATLATSWDDTRTITIATSPGDLTRGFQIGDTVELIDVETELRGLPGTMLVIADLLGETMTLSGPHGLGAAASGAAAEARKLRIRRWVGPLVVPKTNAWQALGPDGVRIRFDKTATYRTGQFWSFAARTATNDIEWPGGSQPPANPPHLLAPLARIRVDNAGKITVLGDCRPLFPPLGAMISLLYVGGDGQQAEAQEAGHVTPLPLARPLEVAVMRGKLPVVAARVEFRIVGAPNGRLDNTATTIIAQTNGDGIASCNWALDPGMNDDSQRVEARMLDDGDAGFGNPVRFAARAFALVEMKMAGGDTQTEANPPGGTAPIELPEPLRVAVTRANRPLGNALVRFEVLKGGGTLRAVGGGAGATAVDIRTDADGNAECLWALIPGQSGGRVVARLMKDAATPWGAPNATFVGNLIDLPRPGSACCVTVGRDGDFSTIDEALLKLLDKDVNDICICLMAGDHVIRKSIVIARREGLNLMIHGCGPASRLDIRDQGFALKQMGAFELADLTLTSRNGTIRAVELESVTLRRINGSTARTILESRKCAVVTVEDCDLRWEIPREPVNGGEKRAKAKIAAGAAAVAAGPFKGSFTAVALAPDLILFADFEGDIRILRNRIHGCINFGGKPPSDVPLADYWELWRTDKGTISRALTPGGALTISGNLIYELRVTGALAIALGLDKPHPDPQGTAIVPIISRFEQNQVLAWNSILPGLSVIAGSNHFTIGGPNSVELLVISPRGDDSDPRVKLVGNLGPVNTTILSTGFVDQGANRPMRVLF